MFKVRNICSSPVMVLDTEIPNGGEIEVSEVTAHKLLEDKAFDRACKTGALDLVEVEDAKPVKPAKADKPKPE